MKRTKSEIRHLFRLIMDERETLHSRWRWRGAGDLTNDQYNAVVAHLNTEIDRLSALYHGRPWPRVGAQTHYKET